MGRSWNRRRTSTILSPPFTSLRVYGPVPRTTLTSILLHSVNLTSEVRPSFRGRHFSLSFPSPPFSSVHRPVSSAPLLLRPVSFVLHVSEVSVPLESLYVRSVSFLPRPGPLPHPTRVRRMSTAPVSHDFGRGWTGSLE